MKIDIGAQEHNHDAEEEDDLGCQTLRGVFRRQLDENDVPLGFGKASSPKALNFENYEGTWLNGEMHGIGKFLRVTSV